jgi:predicted RNA-binding protein with TRAM domain
LVPIGRYTNSRIDLSILIGASYTAKPTGGAMMSYNEGGFGRSNRGYGGGRRFGGNRRFDDNKPKPVETGKEYDVSVTEISRKGDGIARIEGFVIFVKNGKAGQNAKVKILEVGQRFATAEIVEEAPQV